MVSHLTDMMPDAGDGPIMQLPTSREIIELTAKSKKLFAFVCELPERYREIIFLYDKSYSYGAYGYYPILQIQSSLRISNFLSFAFLAGFKGSFANCAGISWSNDTKSLTAEIAVRMANSTGTQIYNSSILMQQQSSSQIEKTALQNGIGVTRLDIMTWITRISLTGNEFLSPKDYLMVLSSICTLCCRIDANRKHAFFLRLVSVASRNLEKSYSQLYQNSPTSYLLKNWSLVVMHRVCDMLENPKSKSGSDDELWLEHYRSVFDSNSTSNLDPPQYSLSLRYGWPALRIGILKEAIVLSDSSQDHVNTIVFAAKLLRKFYRNLGRIDQQHYSELLLRVVLNHRKQLAADPEKTPVMQIQEGMELGVLLLLKMEVVKSTARYNITEHSKAIINVLGTKNIFLYSPFAKKKTENKELMVLFCK
jgi:Transport protein Trs120 or TRAPPC9, TRAPP II complex subunit